MDRIGGDVSIWSVKGDFNDNKIVNVLQIVPDEFLGMLRGAVLDYQVSCSTDSYLVGYMARQDELSIVPTDLDLLNIRKGSVL